MLWIMLALVAIAVLIVLTATQGKGAAKASAGPLPYGPGEPLFSAAERSFLGVLDQALGPQYRVFGKVRIADLVTINAGLSRSAHQGALNRIASKHVDFVVCTAQDMKIICAIELNDSSHSQRKRRQRDDFVAQVFTTVGLPLLTVPAQATYQIRQLRAAFHDAVGVPVPMEPSTVQSSRAPS